VIPLPEARSIVLDRCPPQPPMSTPVDAALGCVTTRPVVSAVPVPPFDNSAVDGYAVRAADVKIAPVVLDEVAAVMAGTSTDRVLGDGEAIRIMTGAPLPAGTEAVAMIEDVEVLPGAGGSGGAIRVGRPLEAGENLRRAGDDIVVGQEVVATGTVLSPAHVGVLVSVGVDRVEVVPRPRVGVLSTGDELTPLPEPLGPGGIRDSNRHMLLGLVGQAGFDPIDLGVVPDDEERVAAVLQDAVTRCDAIVTSGGVSVGDRDVVKATLDVLTGGAMRWMQIAIKPAKPFAFGLLGDGQVPVFGLPGNPVSALVSFELLAAPALRRMAGRHRIDRPVVRAQAATNLIRRPDGKVHFARVVAGWTPEGSITVAPVPGQQSHQLHAMAEANALAVLPDGPGVAAGDTVHVLLLDVEHLPGALGIGGVVDALTGRTA